MNLCSHAGRANSCKEDSRYPPLCAKRRATSGEKIRTKEQEEAQDPDAEARQEFWSIVGDYIIRNHVAPRTKLSVPKDDFPIPLNYIDVQRDENEQ